MSWICNLSSGAAEQLRRLPKSHQKQISRAIEEMKEDPLKGDVRPIRSGKFRGIMRKRVGRYRIIFSADCSKNLVEIVAILIRSEKTYR